MAQSLLDDAVPGDLDEEGHPKELYAVYEGAIYVAYPTENGKSYHGFPWRGDCNPNWFLPQRALEELKKRSEQDGYAEEFNKWKKKYHP